MLKHKTIQGLMGNSLWLLLLLFGFTTSLYAQKEVTFQEIDFKTYTFYQLQQWDSIAQYEKISRKNNFSSYALDFRFGAAFYHKKDYRKALQYFEKLDLRQSHDLLLYEYRYFAYVFSARLADARKLVMDFKNLNRKVNFAATLNFGEVGLENKTFYSAQKQTENNYSSIHQQYLQARIYTGFFMNFHTLKNLELTFAPMWLNERISYLDSSLDNEKWEENIFQKHLYMSGKYRLGYGKAIGLSYHHTATEINSHPVDSEQDKNLITEREQHLFGLFYQHSLRDFEFNIGTNYSPNDSILEFLPSFSLTYYPFGNDMLYLVSRISFQKTPSQLKLSPWVVKQTLGIKMSKKIWLEGMGQWGKINRFYDDNAYVIYNQNETIKSFWGVNVKYLVHRNWELFASFVQYNTLSSYQRNGQKVEDNFPVNSALFGLKWKFYKN